MRLIRQRGQSVTEYAIVFSIVAAAVIGMQIFVKRGLQGKQKDVTDFFTGVTGDAAGVGKQLATIPQYEPYYASSTYNVTQGNTTKETVAVGGTVTRNVSRDSTTRTGSATTGVTLGADKDWK